MACRSSPSLADRDLAGLGLLSDRDLQREHPGVIAGGDALGVEVVAQDQLTAEHAPGPFGCDQFGVACPGRAFSLDGDHVAFDIEVDRLRIDSGQIELDLGSVSPSRQASIGITAGRARVPSVPNTCWVSRSSSRNGSVRISIGVSPPSCLG